MTRPKVGDEVVQDVLLDEELVARFGNAVGDLNPVHFDAEHAAGTRFGRPIVHGTLLLGLIGQVMGMRLPGPGTVYLEHAVRFRKAIPVGERARLRVRVAEARERDRFVLRTEVLDADGAVCVEGDALVWLPAV